MYKETPMYEVSAMNKMRPKISFSTLVSQIEANVGSENNILSETNVQRETNIQ